MENKDFKSIRVPEDTYYNLRDIQHTERIDTLTATVTYLADKHKNELKDLNADVINVINRLREEQIKTMNKKMRELLEITNKVNEDFNYDTLLKLCSKEDLERIGRTHTLEETESTIKEIWNKINRVNN